MAYATLYAMLPLRRMAVDMLRRLLMLLRYYADAAIRLRAQARRARCVLREAIGDEKASGWRCARYARVDHYAARQRQPAEAGVTIMMLLMLMRC